MREAGFELVNADCVLVGEDPRLGPVREEMCERLASTLGVESGRVTVRATTTDGLGFTGRGEGLAAHAVALLRLMSSSAMPIGRISARDASRACGRHVPRVPEQQRARQSLLGTALYSDFDYSRSFAWETSSLVARHTRSHFPGTAHSRTSPGGDDGFVRGMTSEEPPTARWRSRLRRSRPGRDRALRRSDHRSIRRERPQPGMWIGDRTRPAEMKSATRSPHRAVQLMASPRRDPLRSVDPDP